MENNTGNNISELDEMRGQMQRLRDNLDKQIEVNEELLTAQLKRNSKSIKSNGLTTLVAGVLGIYPIIVYSHMYGLSKVCTIASIAVLLIDGILSYCITHSIKDSELSEGNVSDILASVLKARKITRTGTSIEIAVAIAMILWICYETIFGPRFPSFSQGTQTKVIVGLAIGIILGIVIMVRTYRKHTGAIKEIVKILSERQRQLP